jgi:hypothetical protein
MPKRIVDGEAVWRSSRVKKLPEELRLHYIAWIPLAEANGAFEADSALIWTRVYAYLMPSFTEEDVEDLLSRLEQAGLLTVYHANGKRWAYFNGMEKPGRLPSEAHQARYSELPPLPEGLGTSPGLSGTAPGQVRNNPQGFGFGFGIGLVEEGSASAEPSSSVSTPEETTPGTPQGRKPGDPGYWEDGQYSWANNTKKVFGVMKEKWQNVVGRGCAVEMPFKGWREAFVNMLNSSDADTIIPAFELWAFERGKYNPTTQPIIDFIKDGWQKWTERVGPMNQFDAQSQDAVITDEMRAQWVKEARANCAANLEWYKKKLREAEGDYEQNAQLFDEETQKQMLVDIEELKAEVARLEAEEQAENS